MGAILNPFARSASTSSAGTTTTQKVKQALTPEQQHLYANETLFNFRWIAKVMASRSTHVLMQADLVPVELEQELAEIGQFSELAYCESSTSTASSLTLPTILDKIDLLTQPDFPLEGYDALPGCIAITSFSGKAADLGAFVIYRPSKKELVVGISGTKTLTQVIYDLRSLMCAHPSGRGKAHTGFWAMYQGLEAPLLEALRKGLDEHDVQKIAFTGHSMGGAIAYFLVLDIITDASLLDRALPPITLAAFGSPRAADQGLANYWHEAASDYRTAHGEQSLLEYSVKAYNDGVPSLPPFRLGYRHFARAPFYLYRGQLFRVPAGEAEHTLFDVEQSDAEREPRHPRGGHNYYNNRSMERGAMRLQWLDKAMSEGEGWETRYRAAVAKNERRR